MWLLIENQVFWCILVKCAHFERPLPAKWVIFCFKLYVCRKDKKRVKKKEPTVAPTIYQPYPVSVYESVPFQSQPPKAGTPVGSYERSMYYPPASTMHHDTQSMTGYHSMANYNSMAGYHSMPAKNVYPTERVYEEHGAVHQFYEDPPDAGPVNTAGMASVYVT